MFNNLILLKICGYEPVCARRKANCGHQVYRGASDATGSQFLDWPVRYDLTKYFKKSAS